MAREVDVGLSGPVRMVEQFRPHPRTRERALLVNVTSGLAFVPFPASPVYSAAKAGLHAFTRALRVQLAGTGVRVVELAPPVVEAALLRGEFDAPARGPKPMRASVLAARAVAGIEAGALEIRPGLSNVLKVMSRVAPQFMLRQMARMTAPEPAPREPAAPSARAGAR